MTLLNKKGAGEWMKKALGERSGIATVTARDIRDSLGAEKLDQLIGCADSTCLGHTVEAGTLDLVLSGSTLYATTLLIASTLLP